MFRLYFNYSSLYGELIQFNMYNSKITQLLYNNSNKMT